MLGTTIRGMFPQSWWWVTLAESVSSSLGGDEGGAGLQRLAKTVKQRLVVRSYVFIMLTANTNMGSDMCQSTLLIL